MKPDTTTVTHKELAEELALAFARAVEKKHGTTVCYDAQPVLVHMALEYFRLVTESA